MRLNPLLIALFSLLLGGGGALAFWVVDDTQQRSRCAGPALSQDLQPETTAPKTPAPCVNPELDRPQPAQPLAPAPQPQATVPAETPKPAPKQPSDLTRDELGKLIETQAAEMKDRELTEQDLQRLRELAMEMAKKMEEEELAKFPFQFTATISGTVVDSTGAGVARATVLLSTSVKFVGGADKDTERLRKSSYRGGTPRATTDEAGNFSIEYKQGFSREVESIAFSLSPQGPDRTLGDKVDFSLMPGESKTALRLELPATGSITGRVVTSNGQPVAGAQVMAQLDAPAGNKAAAGRVGGGARTLMTTNAQGRFEIKGLLDGRYLLSATLAGYALQAGEYAAIVTAPHDTSMDTDLVMIMETALQVTLTCAEYKTDGRSMAATFYDGQGNRLSASSARVGQGGVTLFGNAPTQAVCFEISGAGYLKSNRIACSLVAGSHYDAGSLELTMREMPKRGADYDGNDAPPTGETVRIKSRD